MEMVVTGPIEEKDPALTYGLRQLHSRSYKMTYTAYKVSSFSWRLFHSYHYIGHSLRDQG